MDLENITWSPESELTRTRELSWKHHGKRIVFYLPGMFTLNGIKGKFPAISITGTNCELKCEHCRGLILKGMGEVNGPDSFIEKSLYYYENGAHGILISGGCDKAGYLPWKEFIPAIEEVKKRTNLYISIHSGLLDENTALALKKAGVDQALIDVIGDDDTYLKIYHIKDGTKKIQESLKAMEKANLEIVPHIVCGIHYGRIKGEYNAIKIISQFNIKELVIVSLIPLSKTPLEKVPYPSGEEVIRIIVEARKSIPDALISLGCARQRGNTMLETMAIDAGVNRMALPSEYAIKRAKEYNLEIRYQMTCCSVLKDFSKPYWA